MAEECGVPGPGRNVGTELCLVHALWDSLLVPFRCQASAGCSGWIGAWLWERGIWYIKPYHCWDMVHKTVSLLLGVISRGVQQSWGEGRESLKSSWEGEQKGGLLRRRA